MPLLLMISSIVLGVLGYAMYALVLYMMYMLAILFKITAHRDVILEILESARSKYGKDGMFSDIILTKSMMILHVLIILLGFMIVHNAPITTTLAAGLQIFIVLSVLYRHYVITGLVAKLK